MKELLLDQEFLEDFVNVSTMTDVMDLDDMVLVVNSIDDPKFFHP